MESKNESQLKRERINYLIEENKQFEEFLKENRENFEKWLNENFKNASQSGNRVDIKDESNSYEYTMQDDVLKLKKRVKSRFGHSGFGFGCGHPMELFIDLMEMKESEKDETVYEGGYTPKGEEVENIFPLLKEDLINKGEICTAIKKFISEDRKVRLEHQDKVSSNKSEMSKLENEIKTEQYKDLVNSFTPEKLSVLFEKKTTLLNGEKYNFYGSDGNVVKSIKFKKETKDKYYLEFVFADEEEETIKINKKDFKITRYIY